MGRKRWLRAAPVRVRLAGALSKRRQVQLLRAGGKSPFCSSQALVAVLELGLKQTEPELSPPQPS